MPMNKNEKLYNDAAQSIRLLFMDKSVSKEDCKVNMDSLKDEIDMMIESLDLKCG